MDGRTDIVAKEYLSGRFEGGGGGVENYKCWLFIHFLYDMITCISCEHFGVHLSVVSNHKFVVWNDRSVLKYPWFWIDYTKIMVAFRETMYHMSIILFWFLDLPSMTKHSCCELFGKLLKMINTWCIKTSFVWITLTLQTRRPILVTTPPLNEHAKGEWCFRDGFGKTQGFGGRLHPLTFHNHMR